LANCAVARSASPGGRAPRNPHVSGVGRLFGAGWWVGGPPPVRYWQVVRCRAVGGSTRVRRSSP
jgi:hypothetical protein